MEKKRGLGKGLGALLGDDFNTNTRNEANKQESFNGGIFDIDIDMIEANPLQPRDRFDEKRLIELTDSIKTMGIIQPITLRRIDRNQYQIISGERRYRAAKAAGLKFIPAYIRQANDSEMFQMALVENLQREDLNPIEVALSYQKLMEDFDLNLEDLAFRVGKNRTTVNNALRLLKLPDIVQFALKNKEISAGHGRALINVVDPKHQEEILEQIKSQDLSVRQVEDLVRKMNERQKKNRTEPMPALPEKYKIAQQEISKELGEKVLIRRNIKGKGSLVLNFSSDKALEALLNKLK